MKPAVIVWTINAVLAVAVVLGCIYVFGRMP